MLASSSLPRTQQQEKSQKLHPVVCPRVNIWITMVIDETSVCAVISFLIGCLCQWSYSKWFYPGLAFTQFLFARVKNCGYSPKENRNWKCDHHSGACCSLVNAASARLAADTSQAEHALQLIKLTHNFAAFISKLRAAGQNFWGLLFNKSCW